MPNIHMKKLLFLAVIAFSCEKAETPQTVKLKAVEAQDFVGIWKATDKTEGGAKIEISKVGEDFAVIYTYKAERPKNNLIPVTYLTKFESTVGDPYRPRLRTIERVNGQFVTFDYVRISNFPDQISNLSTTGYFQK
jgi:hypothetical protein